MSKATSNAWFVAQLRPHGLAQARKHLNRQGFQTFSPACLTNHERQGKLIQERKPLFPGYLFINFDPSLGGWTAINSTRGISRLITTDPRHPPRPLPEKLMVGLKARCDSSELILPADDLAIGDRIRILSGPFADLITKIDSLPDTTRIGVLIELMGRKVRITLPRSQITTVPS
ncbi:Transcription antitermination protein RfaH (plasmid) [Sulfitobacter sp. DSM 110093]|uniref:transcription termination/antitermination protein NusG n=1 Tax=Sulfitobacter sp. DSM 110093 TaxID=2883127 RepID=UPI001FAC3B38|nr:transcription termination/antitermination NusG family protein [Sulfitobacter sp. DSM 110093]UOA34123.1 Transcription antitermination protein RfaH [Sulfitobacter sp. DSM 110093]